MRDLWDAPGTTALGSSHRGSSPTPASQCRPNEVVSTLIGFAGLVCSAALGFGLDVLATVVGLAPHVLHHIGLLAGVALISGTGGTVLFGLIGLAASIPLLLRLHRRFDTWRAPAIALLVFALMFALSAFVIGPALSDAPAGHEQDH